VLQEMVIEGDRRDYIQNYFYMMRTRNNVVVCVTPDRVHV